MAIAETVNVHLFKSNSLQDCQTVEVESGKLPQRLKTMTVETNELKRIGRGQINQEGEEKENMQCRTSIDSRGGEILT